VRYLFGVLLLLLDHEVVGMALDDSLDLRLLVPRDDGEVGRYGPERLVLDQGQRDLLHAGCHAALTGELDRVGRLALDEALRDIGDALVDVAEQCFIGCEALFSRSHGVILRQRASVGKGLGALRVGRRSWRKESNLQAEEVFRRANDHIAELARERGWRFPVPFLCECSERRCFARVELTLAEYEQVRSHPQRYLTARGHEVEGAFLIDHREHVAFAEKLYARR